MTLCHITYGLHTLNTGLLAHSDLLDWFEDLWDDDPRLTGAIVLVLLLLLIGGLAWAYRWLSDGGGYSAPRSPRSRRADDSGYCSAPRDEPTCRSSSPTSYDPAPTTYDTPASTYDPPPPPRPAPAADPRPTHRAQSDRMHKQTQDQKTDKAKQQSQSRIGRLKRQ